jgi:phenylalanyl-tRNA synthetase alpha chain
MKELDALRLELMAAVGDAGDLDALERIRVSALGKKGRVTEMMKGLGGMDAAARRAAGQALNALKTELADAIETRKRSFDDAALNERLMRERIDATLPVRPEPQGRIHPISQTMDEIVAILGEMGLAVAEGPDIEDDWHNFTALNIPPDHPARQEHDTFYLPGNGDDERLVLHPHLAGADSHHGSDQAADPHHRAGPHLPLRL